MDYEKFISGNNSADADATPPDPKGIEKEIEREMAKRLRVVIALLGISKSALAASIGMSKSYIGDITLEKRSMSILVPYRLRRRWNVNLDWFFTGDGPEFLK